MLSRVTRRTRFAVDVRSVEEGRALSDGRTLPLIGRPSAPKKAVVKKQKPGARARGV
jgi:hypothetical protein